MLLVLPLIILYVHLRLDTGLLDPDLMSVGSCYKISVLTKMRNELKQSKTISNDLKRPKTT